MRQRNNFISPKPCGMNLRSAAEAWVFYCERRNTQSLAYSIAWSCCACGKTTAVNVFNNSHGDMACKSCRPKKILKMRHLINFRETIRAYLNDSMA